MNENNLNNVFGSIGPTSNQKDTILHEIKRKRKGIHRKISKKTYVVLCASFVLLLSITAYAFSTTDYFKSMFGESIYLAEEHINTIPISSSNDNYKITVEAILTDTVAYHAVFSITAANEITKSNFMEQNLTFEMSASSENIKAYAGNINELEPEGEKRLFSVDLYTGGEGFNKPIKISMKDLQFELPVESTFKSITISPNDIPNFCEGGSLINGTFTISPMSFYYQAFLTGDDTVWQIKNHTMPMTLKFKTGEEFTLDNHVDDNSLISGEGISFISGDKDSKHNAFPYYNSQQFKKIIDISMLESITINGVEYSLNE